MVGSTDISQSQLQGCTPALSVDIVSPVLCGTGIRARIQDPVSDRCNKLRSRIIPRSHPAKNIFHLHELALPPPCPQTRGNIRVPNHIHYRHSGRRKKDVGVKNQGIWCINQGSDRNQKESGREKVTSIYYNTVAPYYIFGKGKAVVLDSIFLCEQRYYLDRTKALYEGALINKQ